MTLRKLLPLLPMALLAIGELSAQPCLNGYTLTANPPPVGGTYNAGQTVQFCFTVTGWNQTNANWFHGIEANFGPGWDMSTLVPGPPPPSCSANGSWGWYNSVTGTSLFTNIGPQGPGFFFNFTTPADNNPGNNFGDNCTGSANWQFCWTISVVSGVNCTSGLNLGVTFDTFSDSQTGSWSGSGCNNDPIVPSPPAVTQCCDADAGTNGALSVCSTSPAVALSTSLGGTPDAGGVWTTPGGAPHSGTFNPATDVGGNYTYTVTNPAGPCTATALVNVTLIQQPDAGSNGSITVCAGDAAFALFPLLGGTPTSGGSWTAPGGAAMNGTFTPGTTAGGIYTYTVTGAAPCVNASSTVTVTVNPTPTAGTNGTLSLCSNSTSTPLFPSLGGMPDAGGTWTAPGGGAFSGIYDPAVNASGAYTYTVNGVAPCPNSTATVTVTENAQPNAGTASSATYCSTAPSVDLFTLLGGTPTAGGTWTAPGGGATTGTLNPATAASGNYVYTVTGIAPCVNATATVAITIIQQPSAGLSTAINLCQGSAPIDLYAQLGGTPSIPGTWTGPTGAVVPATFDPATGASGTYTYTVSAIAPCVTTSATVEMTVSGQPNAGTNGALAVCSSGAAQSLFTALGGSPQAGGTWSAPGGGTMNGTFTPGANADGIYTYTIPGVAPCITSTATVSVTTTAASNAGTNGSVTACTTSPPVGLFAQLGGNPQAGGTWTDPLGGPSGGIVDPSSVILGDYTYTVPANAPCPAVSATVAVSVVPPPNSGNNASVSLCSSSAPYTLTSGLGGTPDPGGVWTGPAGQAQAGTFNPATGVSGTYTYTVSAPPPCTAASSELQITIVPASSAGTGGAVSLCQSAAPVNPSTWLTGNPAAGGSWTTPTGATVTTVDPASATSGNYTYTVAANGPCPAVTATVALTIVPIPNAGTDASITLCSSATAYTLTTGLGGSPDLGGTWTNAAGQVQASTFNPATGTPGTYTYTVAGVAPCAAATSQLQVSIVQAPFAGVGGSVSICENAATVDPFTWLSANPDAGGTWTGPTGAVVDLVDPATAASGNYTYTVVGTAPCPAVQAVMALTIGSLPNAGSDGALVLCEGAASTSLLSGLGGTPQPGGTWAGPTGPSNGTFLPGTSTAGTYFYTVNGTAPCTGNIAIAEVVVSVNPDPQPSFSISELAGCTPLQVAFTIVDGIGTQSATWNFGDGNTSTETAQAWHIYQNGGNFTVQLSVTDMNGCTGAVTVQNAVFVSEGPSPFFVPSPLTISVEDPVFDVVHVPQDGVSYAWTVDGSPINGGSLFNHVITPAEVGIHPICLTATDLLGCSNVFCVDILVDDVLTIFVPNAFTPDGSGLNDVFLPSVLGVDPDWYLFTIFDRWGQEIFNTNNPTEGWNGAYRNSGEVLPQGVYVWRLFARDQFSAERRERFGSVTLLK